MVQFQNTQAKNMNKVITNLSAKGFLPSSFTPPTKKSLEQETFACKVARVIAWFHVLVSFTALMFMLLLIVSTIWLIMNQDNQLVHKDNGKMNTTSCPYVGIGSVFSVSAKIIDNKEVEISTNKLYSIIGLSCVTVFVLSFAHIFQVSGAVDLMQATMPSRNPTDSLKRARNYMTTQNVVYKAEYCLALIVILVNLVLLYLYLKSSAANYDYPSDNGCYFLEYYLMIGILAGRTILLLIVSIFVRQLRSAIKNMEEPQNV